MRLVTIDHTMATAVTSRPSQSLAPRVPAPRVELRCSGCGYGVVVSAAPERCPMCGAAAWEGPPRHHGADHDLPAETPDAGRS